MEIAAYLVPAAGILALIYAFIKTQWINKQDPGDAKMVEIGQAIREGAMAFLATEYKVLAIFVAVVAVLLGLANFMNDGAAAALVALSFVVGALASGLAGFIGMRVATAANIRTTAAARKSLQDALQVAFSGGAVMGMSVVGLALLGLGGLYLVYVALFGGGAEAGEMGRVISVLAGFSMGASSIALFARVGGGIYTKAADVGADLVGKVESGLPEDDPRNPATIADNVGDNVGDVAGMGADLFESYIGAIVGAMVISGSWYVAGLADKGPILLPMVLAAVGIVCSILGTFAVRTKEGGNPQVALNLGTFGAAGLMLVATWFVAAWLWPKDGVTVDGMTIGVGGVFAATIIGLVVGVLVGLITEHYCAIGKGPVNGIANQSLTGPATNIIAGLAVGMQSTAAPVTLIAVGIVGAYWAAGLYGIAIAALGMLSTTGIQLAVDAYGPVADNAGGIAEMSHQAPEVRERTDKLDAVGNTTAAIGKGFAIGSAALTALALFSAFRTQANVEIIDITKATTMAGLFIGGMLPFLFSSMAMKAVGDAAMDMIVEVRRQFREIPGLKEGKEGVKADYAKCVAISTNAAIRKMMVPGLMAVVVPVVIGFWDPEALAGVLAGTTVTGVLMAIFMANAGGAWDNAKKSIEEGFRAKDGKVYGKGTEMHHAAVVGDTVGDPFKDTAGPSLNILIKLMSVVALVIAPLIALS
jgi:K(+)-stimulated pyrophosphate-energized sodium pump